jgi:DNA invertase Pin-like site-specific DNA recombinase
MIQERVRAGLERARAQGKHLGRPRIAPEFEAAIAASLAEGLGIHKTAALHGVGAGMVQRIKAAMATTEAPAA